jgi:hypothetical protein
MNSTVQLEQSSICCLVKNDRNGSTFAWWGSSFTVVAIREDKLGVRHASRCSDNNQNVESA